ncbi:MAG: rRNA pseudouridine synthase [Nitrospirae bacterium]|nr:rRNA pseudouridine synthase [Nitrospirota bacterium]
MQERLQKILSKSGIASRRNAEEMILEGRVKVNGRIAVLGTKADFEKDHIKVDGKLIRRFEPKVYIVFNKPEKCITSLYDPEGRPTVKDFLKGVKVKVYPVGRLDYDSEGLLLLTNDGELANAVLHPKGEIPKTYLVKVEGILDDEDIRKLEKGVKLKDGLTAPAKIRKIRKAEVNSWLEITIHEGRNRQVRRMFEKIGHEILKLRRIRINGIELEKLPSGCYRHLTDEEVWKLKKEVGCK